MNSLILYVGITALLSSALVAGVFFAFSSFVMKALARVPSAEGIAAMQSINVVVINPSFLGVFMGAAVLSLGMVVLAWQNWENPSAPFLLAGAMLYLVGTFLITMIGNVPLNNQLAEISAADNATADFWEYYLDRWTKLNTVRTAAAIMAALTFTLGVLQRLD